MRWSSTNRCSATPTRSRSTSPKGSTRRRPPRSSRSMTQRRRPSPAADLVVVGGPTHVHGMSSQRSRAGAEDMAAKDDDLDLDPDAYGDGLRDWFEQLADDAGADRLAAAFDTRVHGSSAADRTGVEGHRQAAAFARLRPRRRRRELLRRQVEPPRSGRSRACNRLGPNRRRGRSAQQQPAESTTTGAPTTGGASRAARSGRAGRRRRGTTASGTRST